VVDLQRFEEAGHQVVGADRGGELDHLALRKVASHGGEDVVGKVVQIDGAPTRIVGIMPPGFDLHDERVEVFLPLTIDPKTFPTSRGSHFLYLVGRLKDGVSPQQAAADLDRMIDQWFTLSDSAQMISLRGARTVIVGIQPDVAFSMAYMGLTPGTAIDTVPVDRVFIGSCTNARLEDLRAAASVARGHHVNTRVRALVVPGSQQVKADAEREGLDRIFADAGFEWREPGCSMCLGMNDDILGEGERCASTSNRNFEGRQGRPSMAASPMFAIGSTGDVGP